MRCSKILGFIGALRTKYIEKNWGLFGKLCSKNVDEDDKGVTIRDSIEREQIPVVINERLDEDKLTRQFDGNKGKQNQHAADKGVGKIPTPGGILEMIAHSQNRNMVRIQTTLDFIL